MQRLMETQDSTQYNEETETQTQLMHFQDQLTRLTHDREARYKSPVLISIPCNILKNLDRDQNFTKK